MTNELVHSRIRMMTIAKKQKFNKERFDKICERLVEKYIDCYPYGGVENHESKAKDIDIKKEFGDES